MTNSSPQPDLQQALPVISVAELARRSPLAGSLSIEDPTDKQHRLQQEANEAIHKRNQESAEATHKRWRNNIVLAMTLLGLGAVFVLCVNTLNNSKATLEDKKSATTLITSIVSASVGYVTGKAIA